VCVCIKVHSTLHTQFNILWTIKVSHYLNNLLFISKLESKNVQLLNIVKKSWLEFTWVTLHWALGGKVHVQNGVHHYMDAIFKFMVHEQLPIWL